jgi:PPK2 family polyphosphate:nucleotide phosphotransferase
MPPEKQNAHSHNNLPKLQDPSNTYKIKPKQQAKLNKLSPSDKNCFPGDKSQGKELHAKLNLKLEALQELLYAEHKHKILIVLQAMDTGGKDGVIRKVFEGVNPQGVRVAPFKTPTTLELDHDYLWRIHQQTPGRGEIVIFNRSHYEDVLVVRVHELVSREIWRKRYNHINHFEKILSDEGTTILKFFLHISYEEQSARLVSRIDEPDKQWKFNPGDLEERKLWDQYMGAYEDVLNKTSTPWAPWYVIPANRKWYRDLVISAILVETLEKLKMKYPKPPEDLDKYRDLLVKTDQSLPVADSS